MRLDWTAIDGEGANKGFFCLQVKGEWFEKADGEVTSDFLQLLAAYGPYRVTRLDVQQTIPTEEFLTPWWISAFEVGALKVVGKKYFEPRGKKRSKDEYPLGATIYHGVRTSERFARQYDKHKKSGVGPPRRRDEIEIKGDTSRKLWDQMQEELLLAERNGEVRGARLRSFSKQAIRAYLPIRDTSRWMHRDLPQNWAQIAEEPVNWTELFDDKPISIQPAPRRVSGLLKSYRYANQNFGSAVAVQTIARIHQNRVDGMTHRDACENALMHLFDDFVNHANEKRVMEFLDEFPPSMRGELEVLLSLIHI